MKGWRYPCGLIAALTLPAAALAQAETTTFEYDAQGRLTESSRSGGPASGTVQALSYDRAGNRTNLTVTGAPGGAALMGAPGSAAGMAGTAGDAAADGASADSAVDAAADVLEPADAPEPADEPPVSEGAPLLGESPPGEAPEAAEASPEAGR